MAPLLGQTLGMLAYTVRFYFSRPIFHSPPLPSRLPARVAVLCSSSTVAHSISTTAACFHPTTVVELPNQDGHLMSGSTGRCLKCFKLIPLITEAACFRAHDELFNGLENLLGPVRTSANPLSRTWVVGRSSIELAEWAPAL